MKDQQFDYIPMLSEDEIEGVFMIDDTVPECVQEEQGTFSFPMSADQFVEACKFCESMPDTLITDPNPQEKPDLPYPDYDPELGF